MPLLVVSCIHKSFDGALVLHDAGFDVAHSEIICLQGTFGCGKKVLLKLRGAGKSGCVNH